MSLETIERKLLSTGKLPFWKFLIFYGLLPSTITLSVSYTFAPSIFAESQTLGVKIFGLLSLSAFYMIVSFAVILTSVGILRGLSKLSNGVTYRTGVFAGHSLATNHEFLRKLAQGLYQYLIEFIRGYNDPRFQELEERHKRENGELEKENTQLKNYVKELEEMILPHIARQDRNSYDQNLRIKNLEELVKDIKQSLEKKSPENSISLRDLERITSRLLKVEEELRKLKGE